MFSLSSFWYCSFSNFYKFLDWSAETSILLQVLISLISFLSFFWKSLFILPNSILFIINVNSLSKSDNSGTDGGHIIDLKRNVPFLLSFSFPQNSYTFHGILFTTFSIFDMSMILYWYFDKTGMFFFEKSILSFSIIVKNHI